MIGRQSYILGCDFAIRQLTKKGSEFFVVYEGNQYIQVAWKDIIEWLEKEYNKQEPTIKNDLEFDCIDRDSAIKALDYDIKCFEFKSGVSKHMDDIAKLLNTIYETQVNNIKALPSVTPQKPRWIPCSERLPEENVNVLVVVEFPNGKDGTLQRIEIASFGLIYPLSSEKGWITNNFTRIARTEVIAWMPLPKPYSEVEE